MKQYFSWRARLHTLFMLILKAIRGNCFGFKILRIKIKLDLILSLANHIVFLTYYEEHNLNTDATNFPDCWDCERLQHTCLNERLCISELHDQQIQEGEKSEHKRFSRYWCTLKN